MTSFMGRVRKEENTQLSENGGACGLAGFEARVAESHLIR